MSDARSNSSPGEDSYGVDDADEVDQQPSGVMRARARLSEYPDSGKPRVRAGWTLVDEYVRDGFSYQVLRRPLEVAESGPRLTKREEEVLEQAREGHSNKSIAYALGLSPSTVGVLLFRAAAKFGVKTRLELLSAYLRAKSRT